MSAMQVIPLRKPAGAAQALVPPPLPARPAPPPLASMRVPKGVVAANEPDVDDDWTQLAAAARARADEDDWERAVAEAKARLEQEEHGWAEALARAKRIAALEPPRALSLARPRPPARPAKPSSAARPPRAQATACAPAAAQDEEAEWGRLRAQAAQQLRTASERPLHQQSAHQHQSAVPPAPLHSILTAPPSPQPRPALRVVAWP